MTSFNKEKAEKSISDHIEEVEKKKLLDFKVVLKLKDIANKPEDEEILLTDDEKPNGPQNLAQELGVQKHLTCAICKNIPVAPVVQCQSCEQLYCSQQCLDVYKKQIEENNKKLKAPLEEAASQADNKVDDEEKVTQDIRGNSKKKSAPKTLVPTVFQCLNKKCKSKDCFKTEPISRIVRNILSTFEFNTQDENGEVSMILSYEKMIKEQKEQFKKRQVFSCPLGCEVKSGKPKLAMQKDEMKKHLMNDCQLLVLECSDCNMTYAREDFYQKDKHDCIKNLMSQINTCSDSIKQLKVKCNEQIETNKVNELKIKELEATLKELNEKKSKIQQERHKHEQKHQELFGQKYLYKNEHRLELKMPKNFVNTPENIEKGEILDGPIQVDLARKKKGDGNWNTTATIKIQFKRKIAFNGFSYQVWQDNSPKKEEEKEKEENNEHRPGNRSYMYIYTHDNRNQQFNYIHYNDMKKEKQNDDKLNFRWRNCQPVVTDSMELRFHLYYDLEREKFEKLLVGDFKFYY